MLLSLNWLREITPFEGEDQLLADRLTMLGLEVEEVLHPFEGISGVVVGHVVECAKHPEADRLSLCKVDAGAGEILEVVCGAPNVAAGQNVALAKVGTSLPNGLKIKKSRIRGAVSQGMICAEDELGLGEDHTGIMVLDPSLKPGTGLAEALGLDQVVFDIGVTPNRADCLSVIGLARETAMSFNLPVAPPSFEINEFGEDAASLIRIEIPEPELCPVYQARIIEGAAVGRSPAWLRYRLLAVGLRPINNIVDATNYVMMELGQPLHAFDLDLIEGGKIRVARAENNMRFTTLDNQERKLNDQDLLIWDGKKPVALAGVMGGLNSEINDSSTRVLLESAVFKPASVRKTARRLSLGSEASFRFERGVDQPGSHFAMNQAAALIAGFSGGKIRPGVAVDEPSPWRARTISFRPSRARKLLGIPLEDDFCRRTINGMGCEIDSTAESEAPAWSVTTPSHRLDLEREVDIIEELGRVYGMDRIPAVLPRVAKPMGSLALEETKYGFWMKLKNWGRGVGLCEAVNYSFVGSKDLDLLDLPQEGRIPVKNPLSEEQETLRLELAPGLLQTLRRNIAQGADSLRLFELAHIFVADEKSETTAREPSRLDLLLYGERFADRWPFERGDADYLDLKGLVEHLLDYLGLGQAVFSRIGDVPWLDPCVAVELDGRGVGVLGQVREDIADKHHARKPVWMADLDADLLFELSTRVKRSFQDLPKFPPVRRDMTLGCPDTLSVGKIIDHVEGMKLSILESFILVDVFTPEEAEGEQGARRLTFRLTFRHGSRTLKDKEVDKEREKVADSLAKALGVEF